MFDTLVRRIAPVAALCLLGSVQALCLKLFANARRSRGTETSLVESELSCTAGPTIRFLGRRPWGPC
jgi:hypothetical protein